MKLGIAMFPADHAMAPDAIARAVEERGFSALAFPEHTHIPTSRRSPWFRDLPLPDYYARTHDPFIALTAAAMVTERIELWTGICLLAQRDPIVTAKVVASLDQISNGRFVFGIGFGWNAEEAENHGVTFAQRREMVREKVLAMKALWTADEASFQGEHVSFEPSWSWPKPHQQPHPRIMLGAGAGPKAFAHVAEYCDGWMPIGGVASVSDSLDQLHVALTAQGRDPKEIEITVFGTKPERDRLDHYRELGVSNVFLYVPPDGPKEALEALDSFVPLLEA